MSGKRYKVESKIEAAKQVTERGYFGAEENRDRFI